MAKRPNPSTSSSEEIVGYLHDISPIKTSKNNTRYFNATLQNRDEFHRLVCFSPDKLSAFTNAEKIKSPLKLTNIAMVPSVTETGKIDIKVSRFSNLNIVEKLPFRRRKLDFDDNVSNPDELKISHQTVKDAVNSRWFLRFETKGYIILEAVQLLRFDSWEQFKDLNPPTDTLKKHFLEKLSHDNVDNYVTTEKCDLVTLKLIK
ncbi:unnamed protein product [Mytilus coruscus]|uniref:Uncharacterized protein n=1 Tax=Mytilus coruscus TaxID=42192 RepID=A0A6J8E5N7_MYTCO|nr:unnamed protein product [Mytilus coruscus]